ncbi:hypothetical protein [Pleurochrysis sp. endemic virus 2]|nr:hypothetical protein [Pleurochrysis sp. endemic virus 2]
MTTIPTLSAVPSLHAKTIVGSTSTEAVLTNGSGQAVSVTSEVTSLPTDINVPTEKATSDFVFDTVYPRGNEGNVRAWLNVHTSVFDAFEEQYLLVDCWFNPGNSTELFDGAICRIEKYKYVEFAGVLFGAYSTHGRPQAAFTGLSYNENEQTGDNKEIVWTHMRDADPFSLRGDVLLGTLYFTLPSNRLPSTLNRTIPTIVQFSSLTLTTPGDINNVDVLSEDLLTYQDGQQSQGPQHFVMNKTPSIGTPLDNWNLYAQKSALDAQTTLLQTDYKTHTENVSIFAPLSNPLFSGLLRINNVAVDESAFRKVANTITPGNFDKLATSDAVYQHVNTVNAIRNEFAITGEESIQMTSWIVQLYHTFTTTSPTNIEDVAGDLGLNYAALSRNNQYPGNQTAGATVLLTTIPCLWKDAASLATVLPGSATPIPNNQNRLYRFQARFVGPSNDTNVTFQSEHTGTVEVWIETEGGTVSTLVYASESTGIGSYTTLPQGDISLGRGRVYRIVVLQYLPAGSQHLMKLSWQTNVGDQRTKPFLLPASNTSVNETTVSHPSTGVYVITLAEPIQSNNYMVFTQLTMETLQSNSARITYLSNSSFQVTIYYGTTVQDSGFSYQVVSRCRILVSERVAANGTRLPETNFG